MSQLSFFSGLMQSEPWFGFWLALTLKSVLILGAAWMITAGMQRAAAATRHLVWCAALAGVLALPVLGANLPAIPMPDVSWNTVSTSATGTPPRTFLSTKPAPTTAGSGSGSGSGSVPVPPFSTLGVLSPKLDVVGPTAGGFKAGPETKAPRSLRGFLHPAPSFFRVVAALWLLGVLITANRFLGSYRAVHRLAGSHPTFPGGRLSTVTRQLTRELELGGRVRLLQSAPGAMPMAWGIVRPTLFLPPEAESWSGDRQRHVILHELIHIKRGDLITQAIAQLVCVLYWMNPLSWLAARRLRHERELATDDSVLSRGARPSTYAEHLLEVAAAFKVARGAAAAGLALIPRAYLRERLTAVLTGGPRRSKVGLTWAFSVWTGAALLILPVAALDLGPATAGPEINIAGSPLDWLKSRARGTSTSIEVDGDDWDVRVSNRNGDLNLKIRGKVTFAEDESDVIDLARGGLFRIKTKTAEGRREIEIRERNGSLEREWKVDTTTRPYDEEARAWLARTLPEFFRASGHDAEARVQRILSRNGVDGMFAEIELISSSHVKRRYYAALQEHGNLTPDQVGRVIEQAGREITSDYELAQLLVAVAEIPALAPDAQLQYARAAETIGSDYEQARALKALARRSDLTAEALTGLLETAAGIGSDYEVAQLLTGVAKGRTLGDDDQAAFFDAIESIGSDYERRRTLTAFLNHQEPSQSEKLRILQSVSQIGSDYERASFLVGFAERYPVETSLVRPYFSALSGIGSSYELRRVLSALMKRRDVEEDTLIAAIDIAGKEINSNYELAEFLVQVARVYSPEGVVRDAYLRAAKSIGSEHEQSRALAALVRHERGS